MIHLSVIGDPAWVFDPGLVSPMTRDYRNALSGGEGSSKTPEGRETMAETGGKPASKRVSLSDIPRVHGETALQKVGGRWVAATPDDQLHSFEGPDGVVSEVGERIVELIDGRRSVEEIVMVLLEEFEVPREVAEQDTLEFIGLLAGKQVLSL